MLHYDYKKYGLLCKPDLGDEELNDTDFFPELAKQEGYSITIEFSDDNVRILRDTILKLGENCKAILEIGINKNAWANCSTHTILGHKLQSAKYLGIDILPERFGGFESAETGSYGLCCDSSEYEKVIDKLKEIGVEKLDLIMIDGYHSVNQVLRDWKYTEILSDHGCVLFHDSNIHPGPKELLKSLDPKVWKLEQHCENKRDDWGIAVVWKIK